MLLPPQVGFDAAGHLNLIVGHLSSKYIVFFSASVKEGLLFIVCQRLVLKGS